MKTNDILLDIISKSLSKTKGKLYTDKTATRLYSTDASIYMVKPLAVYIPENEQDIRTLIKVSSKLGVSLHPRGGSTGLAGESLGSGIVVDLHQFFQDIDVNPQDKTAVVGCGVVLDQLNRKARKYGLMFGPDPSSATRCTIGGMIANNSTGTHSLKYGYTSDHVKSIMMLDCNGDILELKSGSLESQPEIFQKLVPIIEKYRDVINNAYPDQDRNRCGYNLKNVWDGNIFNPIPLICGSEATFGIIVSATLSLVEIPQSKAIGMFIFENTYDACNAVNEILPFKPAGLELITEHVIRMGRKHDERLNSIIPEKANAVLLAEWSGKNIESVKEQMYPALAKMRWPDSSAIEVHEALDKESMDILWLIRKEAEALILNREGESKAISFVEDTAISPDRLGEWYRVKEDVLKRFNLDWATFGHAGSGELHTKLFINVKEKMSYKQMVDMTDVLYGKLIDFGGSISGEHGDGFSRTPYIKKQYPTLYPAFVEIKNQLDPLSIFNPGKKVFDYNEHPVLENSRLGGFEPSKNINPSLYYAENDFDSISTACHGCGACRNLSESTTMCPFFKILDTEFASPRARGNLARLRLGGELSKDVENDVVFKQVLSSCFNCKMCVLECPSHVDIPHLTLEIKNATNITELRNSGFKALTKLDSNLKLASNVAGLSNRIINSVPIRKLGAKVFGVDSQIKMFPFDKGNFSEKFNKLKQPESDRKIVFYLDYHVLYQNHSLGLEFIRLLNLLGYEVIPFTEGGCGLVSLDIGDFDGARKIIDKQKTALHEYVEKGFKIVTTEPSAALMLATEWPCLKDDEIVRKIARNVIDCTKLLPYELRQNDKIKFKRSKLKLAYHEPCHLKALKYGTNAIQILEMIPGLCVEDLKNGCCGMAGVWGMFEENRQLSIQMASDLYSKLRTTNYDFAVSECSTCRLQIFNAETNIDVVHPVEIIMHSLV